MKSSSNKARHTLHAWLFLAPALVILGVFIFYPMVSAFHLSLYDYQLLGEKKYIGLQNFIQIWKDPYFVRSLTNSFKYLLAVPIVIILSLILALLVEPELPGINLFRAAYYIPVVTSMVVVGITWYLIFNEDAGILNVLLQHLPFVNSPIYWFSDIRLVLWTIMCVTIWKGLGYYMVIFLAGLRAIPPELLEAAIIDGAKKWQRILYIKIPMLWHSVTLVAVISAIAALQVFDEVYVMTKGKPLYFSSTLVYYIYETGLDPMGGLNMGRAAAMGVVLFAIVLLFTIVFFKFLERFYRFER